jgi:hypothetical protein
MPVEGPGGAAVPWSVGDMGESADIHGGGYYRIR